MKLNLRLFLPLFFFGVIITAESQDTDRITGEELIISDVINGFSADIRIPPDKMDLSASLGISALVINRGSEGIRVEGCINGNLWINSCIYLEPGEIKRMEIIIQRRKGQEVKDFPAMNGLPGGTVSFSSTNPAKIEKLTFRVFTKTKAYLTIKDISPYGEFIPASSLATKPGFFPFIDQFGQYKHKSWPGKILTEAELKEAAVKEAALLKSMPGPAGRDRFGGWAEGPGLKATGSFRTEKVGDKWWLVDPEGYLYWSHAFTGVRFNNSETRITGRERFFGDLPRQDEPLGAFYSKVRDDITYIYSAANLFRKYGPEWREKATQNALKRMRSWGINSFGNWSDQAIYLYPYNRIPYTVAVSPAWPKIDGKEAKFPDVFNPAFRESLKTALNNLNSLVRTDSFCIGFFIDNELSVKDLTRKLMSQPAKSRSGSPFIEYLKTKYGTVSNLNNKWKTTLSGWKQMEKLQELPAGAADDLDTFDLKIIEIYYRTCREELKKIAPDKLYFGSRLHCHYYPDDQSEVNIIRIASQYCDVVCFNRYRFSAEDLLLPPGIDKPTIIGEFHFGALDRGLCHTGLRNVASQEQRADAYYQYVKGALENPQLVGTHWFQYSDQAFTGRGDGENYQIGFVDICDNPYPEIVAAARKIGYRMYELRYK